MAGRFRGRSALGILLLLLAAVPARADEPPRVLVIYAETTEFPTTRLMADAFRAALAAVPSLEPRVYEEYLDARRFPGLASDPELRRWWAHKYRDAPPDLIVSVTALPFALVREGQPPLWAGVPIVFNAIAEEELAAIGRPRGSTGVVHRWYVGETAALVSRLLPDVRRLVAPYGTSTFDLGYRDVIRAGMHGVTTPQYEEWNGLSVDEMRARLARAPDDAAIIVLGVDGDTATPPMTPFAMMQELSRASRRPVFGGFRNHVGTGIVGGVMVDAHLVGTLTGELALRVLRGESADAIPLVVAPSRPVFDARQLARFGIPRSALPPGADVLFDEASLIERYRWQILGAIGVLVLQTTLIGVLLEQRRRRLRLEEERRAHMQEIAHLDRVASLGALATSLAHELNQPLTAILTNAQAAQVLLEGGKASSEDVREALADIIDDDRRAGDIIQRMRRMLKKGDVETRLVDLNLLCRDAIRLVSARARDKRVTIESALSPQPVMVRGDGVQLQQVIVNLLLNAIDASAEADAGRTVVIDTTDVAGERQVAVQDAGPGIDPTELDQIFRPFFSTKKEGLGMGLSISRTIVEAHRGRIRVERLERGTVFRLAFPPPSAEGSGTKVS